ncbi:lipoprotein [Streptomyces sp. AC550_RSS872]|uniref:lipoprotein n=1 Tax=Streptomyces sp. AC550_RSS872 TaxID=2823689 RepID=UPI001C25E40A|nr:lipoprotein [Streptomyces sp. AC550_RSS872]
MSVGARRARRRLAQVAVLAGMLSGCAGAAEDGTKASASASAPASATASAQAAGDGGPAVKSGGTIGAAGSACELPVTFDIAQYWEAEAVDAGTEKDESAGSGSGSADAGEDELSQEIADALFHQGPVTAACEVDAKPAGNIGFLRIWTGEPGSDDARTVLEAFLADETGVSKAKYGTFKAGGVAGAEVKYLVTSELLEETKEETALAVTTEKGPVVIHLGGMDTEEHRAMLPAYDLAKETLRVG